MKKIIKLTESKLIDIIEKTISESIKIDGKTFDVVKSKNGSIYVNDNGILGDRNTFISWGELNKIMRKYNVD